jgi:4-hydroxy-4-methyl-2-oxoglutarate aldolase
MADDERTRRLRKLDACAVSDALDRLGLHGVVLGLRPMGPRRRIAGRAVTVRLEVATEALREELAARAEHPRHLCTAAVDASGPGDVIVVANGGRSDAAGWGGTLSLGATLRGIEGVVVDGACRDVDEAVEHDFAVYASYAVPLTARGRIMEVGWNVPVSVGGLTVAPGDLVIADSSGVVFVPAARAQEVLAVGEQIVAREQAMAEVARAGRPMSEVMGADYERLLELEKT